MSRVQLIAGKTGSGKTTELMRLLDDADCAIFFNTTGDPAHDFGQITVSSPGELKAALRRNFTLIQYDPRIASLNWNSTKSDPTLLLHGQAVAHIAHAVGGVTLGVDEMHVFCPGGRLLPQLMHIAQHGRHTWNGNRTALIATSQSPVMIDLMFRRLCDSMRIFLTNEKADWEYFAPRIGVENSRQLGTLEQYSYLHWTDDGLPASIERAGLPCWTG
jgi:hypothetical protein